MKRQIVLLTILMFVTSSVFAADFSPTLLKLIAEPVVSYDFDGSELIIPVDVTGTTAGIIFCVFTRGKADKIGNIINGYLGWHHVNKVDTCIYYSSLKSVGTGATTITWDGCDQDGNIVLPDDYTYYLWAFDNQSAKLKMCSHVFPHSENFTVVERDNYGLPLANPLYYTRETSIVIEWGSSLRFGPVEEKWIIGSNPLDKTLVETCAIDIPDSLNWCGNTAIDLYNNKFFYIQVQNNKRETAVIVKYKWISNGTAELQTDFGEKGYSDYFNASPLSNNDDILSSSHLPRGKIGVVTDGNFLYTGDSNIHSPEPDADLYVFDINGSKVAEIDISDWWSSPDDYTRGGQLNGGLTSMFCRHEKFFLSSHTSCLKQMVDPKNYLANNDMSDFYVWTNGNGDYVLDKNFEETAVIKWVCNDFNVGAWTNNISVDDNLFLLCHVFDVGAASFGLLAPDGTGLGYFAFAGEDAALKLGSFYIDSNTPFDGIYCDKRYWKSIGYGIIEENIGTFFIAHDSIKGVITSNPGTAVEKEKPPRSFILSQNTPNPFNPVTSIPFTLAENAHVTLTVYNIAGKKVVTLADGVYTYGKHSVEWNASRFSSGVYFYKLEAGEFVETKKMMLIR